MKFALLSLAALAVSPLLSFSAHASTTTSATIVGSDSVYNTGTNTVGGGSTVATGIALLSGSTSFTFTAASIGGGVSVNIGSGSNFAGPDGGSYASEIVASDGSLSGIDAPTAGFIAGVFVPAGGPAGTAPTTLNFDGTGGTNFLTLAPSLDQVFFIGDGSTSGGTTQTFYVPTGAGELYLGIADACFFNGSPGCYGDNVGSFALTATQNGGVVSGVSATPEPSSLILLGTGLLGACGAARRRFQQ